MSSTHTVHLNNLPAETRARLAACLAGRGDTAPILSSPQGWKVPALVTIMAVLTAIVGVSQIWVGGFGDLFEADAVLGLGHLAALAALIGAPMVALGLVIRRVAVGRRLPFRPGVYVLGSDLVEARGPVLRITSVAGATFQATHRHLNGAYAGTDFDFESPGFTYRFRVSRRTDAEARLAALRSALVAFLGAVQRQDVAALHRLDVFFTARMSPSWSQLGARPPTIPPPGGNIATPAPRVLRCAPLLGVLALAAAPVVWWQRNAASDDAMYANAHSSRDLALYARRGERHVAEATARIPKVALQEAMGANSLTALRTFLATYPNAAPEQQEAREEIHRRFDRAFESFLARAGGQETLAVGFVKQLLAYQEQAGSPPVTMHVRPPRVASLAAMDTLVRSIATRSKKLDFAELAPHFRIEAIKAREDAILTALGDGFRILFPGDMLEVRPGARLDEGAELPGGAATIEVSYEVMPMKERNGLPITYIETRPATGRAPSGRIYLGIRFAFDVTLRVPGARRPQRLRFEVLPPEHFSVPRASTGAMADADVYRAMTDRAFDRLRQELEAAFFAAARETEAAPSGQTALAP